MRAVRVSFQVAGSVFFHHSSRTTTLNVGRSNGTVMKYRGPGLLVPPRVDVFEPPSGDIDKEEDVDEGDDDRDRSDHVEERTEARCCTGECAGIDRRRDDRMCES